MFGRDMLSYSFIFQGQEFSRLLCRFLHILVDKIREFFLIIFKISQKLDRKIITHTIHNSPYGITRHEISIINNKMAI